jgi:chromate transporter
MSRSAPSLLRAVLPLVLRASATHIGGTATQAWLRTVLVDTGRLPADDFNRCFAVARLTPGTNLLAFHAALGHTVGRWRGTLAVLGITTIVPAAIATVFGVVYARVAAASGVEAVMAGAQAAAIAVLFWTAARLLTATVAERPRRGALLAAATLLVVFSDAVSPIVVLLAGAAAGAAWLRGGE